MTTMTINERKSRMEQFALKVKRHWDFKIQTTTFSIDLDRTNKKAKFANYFVGTKDTENLSLVEYNNDQFLFSLYISAQIDSDGWKQKRGITNNKYINYVYLDKSKQTLFLFILDFNNDFVLNGESINEISLLKDAFSKYERHYLKENGIKPYFLDRWEEYGNQFNQYENPYIKVIWIMNKDSDLNIPKISDKIVDEVWTVSSIFKNMLFKRYDDYQSNNTFTITNDNFVNQYKYIDINSGENSKGTFRNAKRILILPVCLLDIVNWVDSVKKNYRTIDSLFSLNVRDRKKSQNKIATSMEHTIKNEPENFFIYNNGITAIVDEIVESASNNVHRIDLSNIKIINGQQTINTVFNLSQSETLNDKLKKAYVLMRAYQINPSIDKHLKEEIFNEISSATNSQNAIKAKDLMSTLSFNVPLHEKLLEYGINYHFKDGESDFKAQLKALPKTTLQELVKMHFISKTLQIWKRNSFGNVFDYLIGHGSQMSNLELVNYATDFKRMDHNQLANELADIASIQMLFKNKSAKEKLGREAQALDLIILLALMYKKQYGEVNSFDVNKYVDMVARSEFKNIDRNNLYKGKQYLVSLMKMSFELYGLSELSEYKQICEYGKSELNE